MPVPMIISCTFSRTELDYPVIMTLKACSVSLLQEIDALFYQFNYKESRNSFLGIMTRWWFRRRKTWASIRIYFFHIIIPTVVLIRCHRKGWGVWCILFYQHSAGQHYPSPTWYCVLLISCLKECIQEKTYKKKKLLLEAGPITWTLTCYISKRWVWGGKKEKIGRHRKETIATEIYGGGTFSRVSFLQHLIKINWILLGILNNVFWSKITECLYL